MNKWFLDIFVTFFYLGKIPKSPGTMGTLGAIPVWFVMSKYFSPYIYMGFTFFLVIAAMAACQIYESTHATHDSQEIVIDEVVGFLITMTWLPMNFKSLIAGFILFRFFDILKPFPISILDKNVKGGVGVVIDDVAAGIIASIILQVMYNYGLLS